MTEEYDIKRNGSGYFDPTAYEAIKKADSVIDDVVENSCGTEKQRFRKLLEVIFLICELSGFHLEGRITVRDKKTGRIWR